MRRSRHLLWLAAALPAVAIALVWVDDRLSRPDLHGFDPHQMGRMEASMWRSYYEGDWLKLAWQTLVVARRQYGFSLWDSVRLGTHAARSAWLFRRDTDDPRCLGELEAYYAAIGAAVTHPLDTAEAARLELEWWKARRRNLPPEQYAHTVAALAARVHDVPAESVLAAAQLRTQAMAYRDARRDGGMAEADWNHVSRTLEEAYTKLQEALEGGEPSSL